MPSVCVGRAVIFLYGCSLPRLMFYYTICQVSVIKKSIFILFMDLLIGTIKTDFIVDNLFILPIAVDSEMV